MTRLEAKDIDHIARQLGEYDGNLKRTVGASLRQIACRAAGVDEVVIADLLARVRFAAIPVSSGFGVIDGFSSAVAAIISYLGFNSFVTASRDVAGIVQGIEEGADVLMLADDNTFVALAPASRLVVDNTAATARGFVAGLELMNGGITGELVLVLGCGPVGVHAAEALIDRGAGVVLCDKNRERAAAALEEVVKSTGGQVRLENDPRTAIERYELIFDATNEGDFIEPSHLTSRAMVAAPGMPCALTSEALEKHRDRVIHDALEIGTATMAVQATAQLAVRGEVKKADR